MGVSSLIGLLIATSGCPFTDFLKPMVRFHLPFATEEETLWRATSTYLLAKYYLKKKGYDPEIELKGLSEIYENIGLVNVAIIKRLQAATEKDSTLNALVVLDVFATSLSLEVEEFWAENEHIFMPFLKSCIEKEEKKITSQFDSDPLLKLKAREVDLRAMENERKKEADQVKEEIDRAKLVQAKDLTEDKLEQNEDLANLRADTSIEKQLLANSFKNTKK